MPEDQRSWLLERHKAMEGDYTRKSQEAAEFRRSVEPFIDGVKPAYQHFAQYGIDPVQGIATLAEIDKVLRSGNHAEKMAHLQRIAEFAGLQIQVVQPQIMDGLVDQGDVRRLPEFHDLNQRAVGLERQLEDARQQLQAVESQRVQSQIAEFAATKAADGKPAYPFFETVKGTMGRLMESGKAATLKDAYDLAAKPILDALAAETAERAKAADAARVAEVERARRQMPVRARTAAGSGISKPVNLDDVISGALDRHGFN